MRIKSLQIKKFKGLKNFDIDFNESVTVLIGENGTGKTTILETIYNTLTFSINTARNKILDTPHNIIKLDPFLSEDKDFVGCKVDIDICDEKNWFIEGHASHEDGYKYVEKKNVIELELLRNPNNRVAYKGDWSALNFLSSLSSFSNNKRNIPRIVYLPTEINFKKYKVESVKKRDKFIDFGLTLNSETISTELKDFLIYQHYRDLEDSQNRKKSTRIKKYKDLFNSFFKDKEFLGIEDLEPLFKIKGTGEIHSVDELSSGEKQIFFRAGSILEYNLENSIILIDEPEISMHPEWQQKILDFYRKVAGDNQLIVATHSPHIVSSCKKEEVRVLVKDNGEVNVKNEKFIEGTYGRTVDQLLLSVFDLKSVRDEGVQSKLDRFKNLYIKKESLDSFQLNEMEELKIELLGYLDPDDPELSMIDIEKNTSELKKLLNELEGI